MPDDPLLVRVKARIESDVGDTELGALITEAQAEIRDRFGPDRDADKPITVSVEGRRRRVDLARPIDVDEDLTIVELVSAWGAGETSTELDADDFRTWNGGRTLERLPRGPNARTHWGDRVEVSYVPVDDQPQRDEVVIKLVQLAVEYRGVASERVGDTQTSYTAGATAGGLIYSQERDRLLGSLAPRAGMLIR